MKVTEYTFRELYHRLCFISIKNKKLLEILSASFKCHDNVNGVLGYGYVDHEQGLTFEILTCAKLSDNGNMIIYDGNDEAISMLRFGSIANNDLILIDDDLRHKFKDKISIIDECYACSYVIEKIRNDKALDKSRSQEYPDDIMVFLYDYKHQPEGCWIRCEDIVDGLIVGKLLNEPFSNFGVHLNDMIAVTTLDGDEGTVCIAII